MPRAKAAAQSALEIDPGSAEAQTTLAHVTYAYDWDWEEADRAFLHAIEIDPGYAFSHHWYALFLSAMERHDDRDSRRCPGGSRGDDRREALGNGLTPLYGALQTEISQCVEMVGAP